MKKSYHLSAKVMKMIKFYNWKSIYMYIHFDILVIIANKKDIQFI